MYYTDRQTQDIINNFAAADIHLISVFITAVYATISINYWGLPKAGVDWWRMSMEAAHRRTHNGLAAIWRSVCIRRKNLICLSVVCVLTLRYKHVHMYTSCCPVWQPADYVWLMLMSLCCVNDLIKKILLLLLLCSTMYISTVIERIIHLSHAQMA